MFVTDGVSTTVRCVGRAFKEIFRNLLHATCKILMVETIRQCYVPKMCKMIMYSREYNFNSSAIAANVQISSKKLLKLNY